MLKRDGRLAQLVAHPLDVREVTSSSLVSSTKETTLKSVVFLCFLRFLDIFRAEKLEPPQAYPNRVPKRERKPSAYTQEFCGFYSRFLQLFYCFDKTFHAVSACFLHIFGYVAVNIKGKSRRCVAEIALKSFDVIPAAK